MTENERQMKLRLEMHLKKKLGTALKRFQSHRLATHATLDTRTRCPRLRRHFETPQ